MEFDQFLKNLSSGQKKIGGKIFDLVVGRVFKRAYLGFDQKGKEEMEKVFSSGSNEEKDKFVQDYVPDFAKIFEEEVLKIDEEIKAEIGKQI